MAKATATKRKQSVSLDEDVVKLIEAKQEQLEGLFGFKPTLSQTVRHIVTITRTEDGASSD